MLGHEPGLGLGQRDARPRADVRRQRQLLLVRELARRTAAVRVDSDLAGQPAPDQRLVDIGDADLEGRRYLPNGHSAVYRRKHPIS